MANNYRDIALCSVFAARTAFAGLGKKGEKKRRLRGDPENGSPWVGEGSDVTLESRLRGRLGLEDRVALDRKAQRASVRGEFAKIDVP